MHNKAKLSALALAVALFAHANVARAQTEAQTEPVQPAPAPESIPGIMVVPPHRPMPLPAARQPDAETCPVNDLKKLDLIG